VPPSACAKNECDQWISVSAQHGTRAVACYAGVGGSDDDKAEMRRFIDVGIISILSTALALIDLYI